MQTLLKKDAFEERLVIADNQETLPIHTMPWTGPQEEEGEGGRFQKVSE